VIFDEIYFLEVEDVHRMHDHALAIAGGQPGVLNEGLVISAVKAPQNSYCGSLAEMAATLAYGLAKNHGYQDANKRTALSAMKAFLDLNGFEHGFDDLAWVAIIEGVADGTVSRDNLTSHIAIAMGGDIEIE
jgi:death-on-curing protein